MPAANNSYVYSIGGLFLEKNSLSKTIVEDIDEFISIAPSLAENVRSSLFERKDLFWFKQHMSMVLYLLKSVSAKGLLADAEAICHAAEVNNVDLCRKKIEPFISDFLSLSIEMQMAQKRAAEGSTDKSWIEAYADILNILTAVLHLIAIGEYKKSRDLLADVEYPGDDTAFGQLTNALELGKGDLAEKLANKLIEKYQLKIEEPDSRKGVDMKEILAVDDRPDVLRTVAGVLREHYKVLTAADGVTALKIIQSKTPDLFILDIEMPNMNGFELASEIRLTEKFRQTPILFLTSNSTREYVLKAIESGGNDFIVKPAKHSMLLSKVNRYLFT